MKKILFDLINEEPRVSQYFYSLEGEGYTIGEPSLYIRLAGCYSAACKFCDTKFSWYEKNGEKQFYPKFEEFINDSNITSFFKKIDHKVRRVTITGGEPLHYMNSFNLMIEKLLDYLKLEHLGIESNGNLLKDISNSINLSKILKNINKNYNLKPMLTISPKLNPEICYPDLNINEKEILDMYKNVINNVINYIDSLIQVNFKFIWNADEINNRMSQELIDYLLKINYSRHKIFLMPFTPIDPLGKGKELWNTSKMITSQKALELGVRYSPRLHIDLNLD